MTPWVTPALRCLFGMEDGFNSATAVTPWVTKRRLKPPGMLDALQFGHGGDAVGDSLTLPIRSTGYWLQFGHGGDAVGDGALPAAFVAQRRASIRPRR